MAAVLSRKSPIDRIKDDTSDKKKQCPARHSRKCKRTEKIDKTLEQFVARRKKAKKDNEKKKAGLQLMITDYFLHTKPVIKKEKKEGKLVDPSPTKDVLQDKRYDYNLSAVLEDDDLEI